MSIFWRHYIQQRLRRRCPPKQCYGAMININVFLFFLQKKKSTWFLLVRCSVSVPHRQRRANHVTWHRYSQSTNQWPSTRPSDSNLKVNQPFHEPISFPVPIYNQPVSDYANLRQSMQIFRTLVAQVWPIGANPATWKKCARVELGHCYEFHPACYLISDTVELMDSFADAHPRPSRRYFTINIYDRYLLVAISRFRNVLCFERNIFFSHYGGNVLSGAATSRRSRGRRRRWHDARDAHTETRQPRKKKKRERERFVTYYRSLIFTLTLINGFNSS